MRKNRMMRLASLMLVLVLLTSSVVSGTFAKYVTTVSGTDTARVARWGFTGDTTNITIGNLFMNAYNNVDADVDVIAPGTENSAKFEFAYNGAAGTAPEVKYNFTVSTDGSNCADAIKNNANIKLAVYKTSDGVGAAAWGTWDAMIAAIEDLDGTETFDPGELPAISEEYTVAWKWDFYTDKTADEKDTTMGNAASDVVTLKITVTATQID